MLCNDSELENNLLPFVLEICRAYPEFPKFFPRMLQKRTMDVTHKNIRDTDIVVPRAAVSIVSSIQLEQMTCSRVYKNLCNRNRTVGLGILKIYGFTSQQQDICPSDLSATSSRRERSTYSIPSGNETRIVPIVTSAYVKEKDLRKSLNLSNPRTERYRFISAVRHGFTKRPIRPSRRRGCLYNYILRPGAWP